MLGFGRERLDGVSIRADENMDRAFLRCNTARAFGAFTETPFKHFVVGRGIVGEQFSNCNGCSFFCGFGGASNGGPVNPEEGVICNLTLGHPCFQDAGIVEMAAYVVLDIMDQRGVSQR